MKALSLSRPWTTAVERHGKRAENRARWTPHPHLMRQAEAAVGQDLALHSSGTYDRNGALHIEFHTGVLYGPKDTPSKAITSVVHVAGLLHPGDPWPIGQEAWYFGDTALLFENVRTLTAPVYMPGGLGFWEVKEPYLAQVLAALPKPEETCVECNRVTDGRQRCAACRHPVCIRCATYDDDGALHCPECLEDAS
ncbi:hypothetical protein [Deinococcus soli (ex Cha et al. 2016)]|uniref:hypothetical protein n=1 Tax=Deinococcus soli (ex Cha et al. 2016) TaxID=1309411 RepID=UPI001662A73C|nr:hypothetical protein [Deinococcus soli (ex Cha et al. 2016)]GGB64677.1 hypothetical protein GCM10008019_21000 [Deinococcus soli (ex Cha et al. 2016)]